MFGMAKQPYVEWTDLTLAFNSLRISWLRNARHMVHGLTGHGHLVVATATQCCIYSLASLNTPHILDLKETPSLILQADRYACRG